MYSSILTFVYVLYAHSAAIVQLYYIFVTHFLWSSFSDDIKHFKTSNTLAKAPIHILIFAVLCLTKTSPGIHSQMYYWNLSTFLTLLNMTWSLCVINLSFRCKCHRHQEYPGVAPFRVTSGGPLPVCGGCQLTGCLLCTTLCHFQSLWS